MDQEDGDEAVVDGDVVVVGDSRAWALLEASTREACVCNKTHDAGNGRACGRDMRCCC